MGRASVGIVGAALVATLGACGQAESGPRPFFDLTGTWSGTLESAASGEIHDFTSTMEMWDERGSLTGNTTFTNSSCFTLIPQLLAGTLRDSELTVSFRFANTQPASTIYVRSELDFGNADAGTGTYEIIETPGACEGETGIIRMQRTS